MLYLYSPNGKVSRDFLQVLTCRAERKFANGMKIRFEADNYEGWLSLLISDGRWRLKDKERYHINIDGKWHRDQGIADGNHELYLGVLSYDLFKHGDDLAHEFSTGRTLTVYGPSGAEVATVSLADSGKAISAIAECVNLLEAYARQCTGPDVRGKQTEDGGTCG
jgi:hypothetical protein